MWREIVEASFKSLSQLKVGRPATSAEVSSLESSLSISLPKDLREFLLEMNGVQYGRYTIVGSTSWIEEHTKPWWESSGPLYGLVNHLVVFGNPDHEDDFVYLLDSKDGFDPGLYMWGSVEHRLADDVGYTSLRGYLEDISVLADLV